MMQGQAALWGDAWSARVAHACEGKSASGRARATPGGAACCAAQVSSIDVRRGDAAAKLETWEESGVSQCAERMANDPGNAARDSSMGGR
jgi:hypothetical protein